MKRQKKLKKLKVPKEPGLLSKVVSVHFEQARRRRALRLLTKQAWSFDFLAMLLVKASRLANAELSLTLEDRNGLKAHLDYKGALQSKAVEQLDDSIFNHLDDDLAIEQFIRQHSSR